MARMNPVVDISTVTKAFEKVSNAVEGSHVVFERTLKDMYSRAPGKVASAVTSIYGIKKGEINCKKGQPRTAAGTIRATGGEIASFELVYSGRVLTPLHFGMTPKARPDKKKYKVKSKIKKTAKVHTAPAGGGVFLAPAGSAGTQQIPWVRNSDDRLDISPIKTLSLPQMVDNADVREVIGAELGELLQKRFDNHLNQYMKKALK